MPLLRQNKTQHSSLLQSSQYGVWERRIYVLSPHEYAIHTCSAASTSLRRAAATRRTTPKLKPQAADIQSSGRMCAPYSTASSSSAPGTAGPAPPQRTSLHVSTSKPLLVPSNPAGDLGSGNFTVSVTAPIESWHTLNYATADPM